MGKISEHSGEIIAENIEQLCDIVGRYTVLINGKEYDTVRLLSLDSYYGEYVCCEQYIHSDGHTILWRRFNRDDWAFDRYQKKMERASLRKTIVLSSMVRLTFIGMIASQIIFSDSLYKNIRPHRHFL